METKKKKLQSSKKKEIKGKDKKKNTVKDTDSSTKKASKSKELSKKKNIIAITKTKTNTKATKIKKPTISKTKTMKTTKKIENKILKSPLDKKKTARKPSKKTKTIKPTAIPKVLPFKINSYIFYPNEGLGQITGIENRKFENVITPYYVVTFLSQKMISRIPVKNIKLLRIRKIFSKDTAQKVLKTLETADILSDLPWKDRLLKHQEVIKKGNALETAEMLSSLHVRSVDRALSFQERQYYDFALESLTDELSIVMKQDVKEILKLVKKILQSTIKNKDSV